MSQVFDRLHASVLALERAIAGGDANRDVGERILAERTARIARDPMRAERPPEALSCLILERCGRRYAIPLGALSDVGAMGSIAHIPGIPEVYLGVTARRGRVVAIVDLPRLFGPVSGDAPPPRWIALTSSATAVCGLAADDLVDVVDTSHDAMASAMPGFPPIVQRHTLGVLEDGTVVIDAVGLVEDRTLRVEERG
ncbi:MAG: chemotaxis protein CheW [Deltaproteobacteria bacterium]|nr:chemotaxis protein CheW [Deltaproteobacteria bacterium]